MKLTETKLKDCYLIEPEVFYDQRGWFFESYSQMKLPGIHAVFVQDNHSYSKQRGTLRGIHFQNNPHAQAKLVRCIRGSVLDVAVDLRPNSDTYKQWIAMELNAENKRMLFLPRGFGHGSITLTDDVEFLYKVDACYAPESDRSIRWDDPEIGVKWGVEQPILSEKDRLAPLLKNSDINF